MKQFDLEKCIKTIYEYCMEARNNQQQMLDFLSNQRLALSSELKKYGNIVEVNNQFKLNDGVSAALATKSVYIDVSSYHQDLAKIKINRMSGHIDFVGDASYLITFEFKKGEKAHFFIKDEYFLGLEDLIKTLLTNIPEKNIEVISKKQFRATEQPKSSSFWSKNWEELTESKEHYDEVSDHFMVEKFIENVLPLSAENKTLVIMDIGGGKARLAMKLIELMVKQCISFHYVLIEPSNFQYKIALETLSSKYQKEIENESILVVNATLDDFSKSEQYPSYLNKANGIILSGGPINLEIVWLSEAEENMKKLKAMCAEMGIIIAAGLSPVFFTRKAFIENYGLTVLNTAKKIPSTNNEVTIAQFYQCYVLQNQSTEEPDPDPGNDSSTFQL